MNESCVPIEAKVAALSQPSAFPGPPRPVEVIETHMSWVFLTGASVYKLKKPVRYDGLDFAAIQARRFYCLEELHLNRRLAPAVYLDVVALRIGPDGALRIGPQGDTVDWLVWMRRLPPELMLDRMLQEGRATAEHMRRIAAHLAGFYRKLEPAETDPARFVSRLARDVAAVEGELCDRAFALPADEVRRVCGRLRVVLQQRPGMFEARVIAGRIVEGHGDLRPEHICLDTSCAIIDCLEFSAALRTLDIADELGFLALECERLGASGLGRALFDAYTAETGDAPDPALVDFYQAFRACVRALIAIRHLKEARYRDLPGWPQRAREYLVLAARHLRIGGTLP